MKISLYIFILILLACCSNYSNLNYRDTKKDLESVSDLAIEALKSKKIFFGHASVGYNIVSGIEEIKAIDARFSAFNIKEINNLDDLSIPGFYHSKNGKNGFPNVKMDSFKTSLKNGLGDKLDVAFFKFCYVDFSRDSDVQGIFNYYVQSIEEIKKEFPRLTVVHVTIPLYAHSWGVKGFIKNLLDGDLANVKRNQFNELLLNKYKNIDPIYDLAVIESLHPDGQKSSFRYKGKEYLSLAKEYTDDGGHLNEKGRYVAAEELLKVLAANAVTKMDILGRVRDGSKRKE